YSGSRSSAEAERGKGAGAASSPEASSTSAAMETSGRTSRSLGLGGHLDLDELVADAALDVLVPLGAGAHLAACEVRLRLGAVGEGFERLVVALGPFVVVVPPAADDDVRLCGRGHGGL